MDARIYLTGNHFMVFETEQIFLKFCVPKKLTTIYEIQSYDSGYMVVDTNYGEEKTEGINKLLATDLENSGYKASFVLRGQHLDLSVSSFRDPIRELHLLEAVKINNTLLIDEVCCA